MTPHFLLDYCKYPTANKLSAKDCGRSSLDRKIDAFQ